MVVHLPGLFEEIDKNEKKGQLEHLCVLETDVQASRSYHIHSVHESGVSKKHSESQSDQINMDGRHVKTMTLLQVKFALHMGSGSLFDPIFSSHFCGQSFWP